MSNNILPSRSTWIHLRFLYSFYLIPVFLFALSQSKDGNVVKIILVFLVLHVFIYPASNGYNSFYDRDEGSIGGIKVPPKVDITLLYSSWFLDIVGTGVAFLIGWGFGLGIIVYGLFSKLYSHPKIRLKSRPIISFLVVFFVQGAFIFNLCLMAFTLTPWMELFTKTRILGALFSSLLIGSMYVMTQIYQHKEDQMRGDITLSALLGIKGTFYFSASSFFCAVVILYVLTGGEILSLATFLAFTFPLMAFFIYWFIKVWTLESNANFSNTMRMSTLSFLCLSAYFIYLIWLHKAFL